MLLNKDKEEMVEVSRYASESKKESLAKGFTMIPKEGMKENRKKILAMKGKTNSKGVTIKSSQTTMAMLVFNLIVENTYQENVQEGNWKDNCMYWTINKMADELGVSRNTIKPAIDLLVEAEVIIRKYEYDASINEMRYFYYPIFIGEEKVKYESDGKAGVEKVEEPIIEQMDEPKEEKEEVKPIYINAQVNTDNVEEEFNPLECDDVFKTPDEMDKYMQDFLEGII